MFYEYCDEINRSALIISPKAPFVEWVEKKNKERKIPDIEMEQKAEWLDKKTVYLIPAQTKKARYNKFIKDSCSIIFEYELGLRLPKKKMWPKNRTWEMFGQWFDYEVHAPVLDAAPMLPLLEDDEEEDDDYSYLDPDKFSNLIPRLDELNIELYDLLFECGGFLSEARELVVGHLLDCMSQSEKNEGDSSLDLEDTADKVMENIFCGLEANKTNFKKLLDYIDSHPSYCGYAKIFRDFSKFLGYRLRKRLIKRGKELFDTDFGDKNRPL